MKNQGKNIIIQFTIGVALVVTCLIFLNKKLPNFTLFPTMSEMNEQTEKEKFPNALEPSKPEKDESDLTLSIPEPDLFFEEDEEESSIKINEIPKDVIANEVYSLDKRLRAGSIGIVTPLEVLKYSIPTYTNSLTNEVCPTKIKNYHKDFTLYFTIRDEKLAESILFLLVKIGKNNYVFKPQNGNNKLVIPNNLEVGSYQLTFGYYLKKDMSKEKIPYYANVRDCTIVIK